MDETSPEAFRERFRVARWKRRFAILVVTTVSVLIGRSIIWLFLPEMTRDATRWAVIFLLPVAWFGWWVGARAGDEFTNNIWKDLQFSLHLARSGARWQSLEQIMAEELGREEMQRRHDRAADAAEDAAEDAEAARVSGVTSPPKAPGGSSKPEDPKDAPTLPDGGPRQD